MMSHFFGVFGTPPNSILSYFCSCPYFMTSYFDPQTPLLSLSSVCLFFAQSTMGWSIFWRIILILVNMHFHEIVLIKESSCKSINKWKLLKTPLKKRGKRWQKFLKNRMSYFCSPTYPPCPILSQFGLTPPPPLKSDIIYVRSLSVLLLTLMPLLKWCLN